MSRIGKRFPGAFGVNITGYGLHNFNRFGNNVRYVINHPLEPKPIHIMLYEADCHDIRRAYTKSNMGMGFAIIVKSEEEAAAAITIAEEEGHAAKIVGYVDESKDCNPHVALQGSLGSLYKKIDEEFHGYG